jgi:hypothetical protein
MPSKKKLFGVPNDLIDSYFATDKYCVRWYMADWLWNAARVLKCPDVTLDIINQTHIPTEFNFHPFTYELAFLKQIVERNLIQNGFDKDFIIEAKIKVSIRPDSKKMTCSSWLIDRDNFKYETNPVVRESYEDDFDPFDVNMTNN